MKRTVTVITVLGLLTLGVGIWFYQFTSRSEVVPEFPIEDATETQATAALRAAEGQVAKLRQLISDLKNAEASSPNLMRNVVLRKTGISGFGENINKTLNNLKNTVGLFLEEHFLTGVTVVSAQEDHCEFIVNNGNPSNKINMVFVSEKYTDQNLFNNDVQSYLDENGFFSVSPFKELKDRFNVFSFFFVSQDFDCTITSEVPRLQTCYKNKILDEIITTCNLKNNQINEENSLIVVIGNVKNSGAFVHSGAFVIGGVIALPSRARASILLHEVGHLLAKFGEEYVNIYIPTTDRTAYPFNTDSEGCPKWCSGILNTIPVCYQDYVDYQSCVNNIPEPPKEHIEEWKNCYVNIPRETQLDVCNLGVECIEDAGCYWSAGSISEWRAYPNTIMRTVGLDVGGYGKINEDYLKEIIINLTTTEAFISEAEAMQISRNAGLEDGITDWETSLHWFAGDLNTYVWTVQNTLSATPSGQAYAVSGETIVIDANSGEVKKVLQWQGMTQSIPEPRSTSVPKEITVTQSIAQAEVSLREAEAHLESAQDAFSAGNFNAVVDESRQVEVIAITAHFTLMISIRQDHLNNLSERAERWSSLYEKQEGKSLEDNREWQEALQSAENAFEEAESILEDLDLSNFLEFGNAYESSKFEPQVIELHASQEQAGSAINSASILLDFIVHGPLPEGDTPPTPPTEGSN